jgi:hypothetical protein
MDMTDRPFYRFEICLIDDTFEHVITPFSTRYLAMAEMKRLCEDGAYIPYKSADESWAYFPPHRIIQVTMRRVK